jgi:hypothetical protein
MKRIIIIPASNVASIAYNFFISNKLNDKIDILLKYNDWMKYDNKIEKSYKSIIENENEQGIDEIFDIIKTSLPVKVVDDINNQVINEISTVTTESLPVKVTDDNDNQVINEITTVTIESLPVKVDNDNDNQVIDEISTVTIESLPVKVDNDNQVIYKISNVTKTSVSKKIYNEKKTKLKKKMICDYLTNIINKSVLKPTEKDVKNEIKIFTESSKIKNNLKKELVSTINKQRGSDKESEILNFIETTNKIKIVDKNNKLYKKFLLEFEYKNCINKVKIIGRIDGIEDNCLIEVKNRTYRIFNNIPDYDKIQIEMYFFLLENINTCKFIQRYDNDYKIIIYDHDPFLLESIKINLINSLKDFLDLYLNN